MPRVTMPAEELFSRRARTVGEMLAPLKGCQVPCQLHARMVSRGKVIGAHDGGFSPDSDYQRWRFRTVSPDVDCQYYELWRFSGDELAARLERAYLHLFKVNRATHMQEEIIAVHAEPYNDDESEYLRGLHLHVNKASHPIPKCHFSLMISHLDDHVDQVLSSVGNFTKAFRRAATLIQTEVVSRYA